MNDESDITLDQLDVSERYIASYRVTTVYNATSDVLYILNATSEYSERVEVGGAPR